VRKYDNPSLPLAETTIFLQPHLAWEHVAHPRLARIRKNVGFISLGPYLNATCSAEGGEKDSHGMGFPRISGIYSMFQGELCPPTGFTVSLVGG
jgi:hypothetical protein